MATRSTTSQYQPTPPNYHLHHGMMTDRIGIRYTMALGFRIKPNMCCAPATNGSRAQGLAPSQPASTKKMMAIRFRW